ncbi:nucleoside diphosphate kinase regulator [Solimonas variicoloris]|uniref:nucleoside diphosphate kinase regulator n=1 Tax=Solimonas variicoloris TaxID=254408 RepID=UPI0003A8E95D|nr:nucleoside diphosphate kinase regulator [Solimonas variicoloris]
MSRALRPAPPLLIERGQYERLRAVALAALDALPELAGTLLDEIERATLVGADALPADVVALGRAVRYQDEASGAIRSVRVVLPHEADPATQRISVLTPVGAALIGLREAQRMPWTLNGETRVLSVLRVGELS